MSFDAHLARTRQQLASFLDRIRRGYRERSLERGQVLPIFAVMTVVILGGAALITDVAWWWTNEQRMQRAADAGALAGAVYLPGDETRAFNSAHAETAKNGYANGVDGVTVTPRRDPTNERKLIVDVDGDVGTHFARVFGMTDVPVAVTGAAEFVLPVPMGSPENYYGVFGMLNTEDGGTRESGTDQVTDYFLPGAGASGNWVATSGTKNDAVQAVDGIYIQTNGDSVTQAFGDFGLLGPGGLPAVSGNDELVITGIEVLLDDVYVTQACSNTFVEVHLADNDGTDWTTPDPATANDSPFLGTTPQDVTIPNGGYSSGQAFESTWDRDDFSDARFEVRLRSRKGCTNSGANIRVDQLRVRVHYRVDTFVPDANIAGPNGEVLTPRGFWASMMTQGAETTNGDAFLPYYNRRTSLTNTSQNTDAYYNYAIEMPPGATGGRVYIFDPGFCSGALQLGLGDSWAGSDRNAVTTYFTLYEDLYNTPYYFDDDTVVPNASSGTLFERMSGSDPNLGGDGTGSHNCDAYHLDWWEITGGGSGLTGGSEGRIYRLHATTFDPNDVNYQRGSNARNHFSIFVDAQLNGGTVGPRVYGIGAMGMFTQLPGGQASEFYLAQIDEAHKGKTMQIQLWDAGDTNQYASIEILGPTDSGWTPRSMTYSASPDSYAASASRCDETSRTGSSITTNNGVNIFNGCWLTITIPVDIDYDAPQDGWWKIRYTMSGSSTATDITTWQVALLGNPVHLVQE